MTADDDGGGDGDGGDADEDDGGDDDYRVCVQAGRECPHVSWSSE